ncbi:hypothetical protein PSHT_15815 [Puccinia striiformis]|uniref:Actin-related protein 2/3 complex subunit 3 n=2 Tax=Puccinia striiformis TaxID=27350 RepID=A0A2S4UDC2_9BASI|nr:hypothetical protein PSHT_15815 [Puccinia striiformis]POW15614.1 hypothetical protein PSTT_01931 [Puccinia striiformis]
MPAYHSTYNDAAEYRQLANMVVLPIRSKVRGPAPPLPNPSDIDIIDESIDLFKSNYCLNKISQIKPIQNNKNEATKILLSYSLDNFYLPGEPGFPMNGIYAPPKDKHDADLLKQYLTQIRQECSIRLIEKVYNTQDGKPSKWWMCFQKRKFMGKSLS